VQGKRDEIKYHLEKDINVNSIYRINNGYDFMIEAIFRNMQELELFMDKLETLGIQSKQEFYILEDVKKEGFISEPELAGILCNSDIKCR
jgi:hypothetical protein